MILVYPFVKILIETSTLHFFGTKKFQLVTRGLTIVSFDIYFISMFKI